MKNKNIGVLILLLKLLPKLLPLIKSLGDELFLFGKTLIGAAGATAAVSAGIYAYLFTWQTGLGLIIFLVLHEYGHVWAMRRSGVGFKGMYFIPFMGAVAISDGDLGSARNEAFIAIMGPVFGFVFFVLPTYIWWLNSGNEAVAAVASVCCFFNLINLLPTMPLDGGRIMRSIGYSNNAALSLAIIAIISAATALGAWYAGFTLFVLLAVIGFSELAVGFGVTQYLYKLLMTIIRGICLYLAIDVAPIFVTLVLDSNSAMPQWVKMIMLSIPVVLVYLLWKDIRRLQAENESLLVATFNYPVRVINEAIDGMRQLSQLRAKHVQPIENYDAMPREAKVIYAFLTLIVGIMHFVIMMQLAETGTGSIFVDMLQ